MRVEEGFAVVLATTIAMAAGAGYIQGRMIAREDKVAAYARGVSDGYSRAAGYISDEVLTSHPQLASNQGDDAESLIMMVRWVVLNDAAESLRRLSVLTSHIGENE